MHPLLRDATRLKVVHRQRVNRQGDAEPMPELVAAGFAPEILGAAAAGWQRLLETEYESIVIAGWMTSALARIGAPLDLIGAFGRVVEDEIRHVDLCAQMVESFGGRPTVPLAAAPPFPTDLTRGADAEFEVIAGLVGFFCVFEFLSGLVFHEAIEAAAEPKPRWALGEIFRDEAFHGAFGFETARYFVPRWTEPARARLAERVAADVARFTQRVAGRGSRPELERLGLLGGEALGRVVQAGIVTQLVPRLAELGISLEVRIDGA